MCGTRGRRRSKVPDHAGKFLTASTDGSKVLLSDGCLYDLETTEECEPAGTPASFQGILGAGDDLSHVYFVDKAILTGGEENANEEAAVAGAFNLYAWSEGGGAVFIGRLSGEDNPTFGSQGTWKASPSNRTAQVIARRRIPGLDVAGGADRPGQQSGERGMREEQAGRLPGGLHLLDAAAEELDLRLLQPDRSKRPWGSRT